MARGSKPGERRGGRKKGTPNLRSQQLGQKLSKLVPDDKLIKLLWRLAEEGDGRCAIYLADRKWGKVPQPMEHSGPGEGPIPVEVNDKEFVCVHSDGGAVGS